MRKPLERDVLRQCLDLLRLRGVLAWRVNSGAVTGEYKGQRRFVRFCSMAGVSDLLGILPGGRFLAVETKRPGGKPTPDQQAFLDRVNAAGGLGICVSDVRDLDRVLAAPAGA